MKRIILWFMLVSPLSGICQLQKYQVKGKISGVSNQAKAYIVYQLGSKMVVDSCRLSNGTFSFSGVVKEPIEASIVLGHQGVLPDNYQIDAQNIYLEKGQIWIEGKDSIANCKVRGTPLNIDQQLRYSLIKKNKDQNENIERKLMSDFVQAHPASLVSLEWLNSFGSRDQAVIDNYPKLSTALKNTTLGKALGASIKTVLSLRIGQLAPDFTLPDEHGNPIKLSGLRGKYVLLDFWASWCKPCRAGQPKFLEFYNEFNATGKFVILAVSLDKEKSAWLKAIQEDKVPWLQVADLKAAQNKAALLYDVTMIPASFLIAPDGTIVSYATTKALLREKLNTKVESELCTLTTRDILANLKAENITEQDIAVDYHKLKEILNTDIGERAMLREMDELEYPKDKDLIYNILRDQGVPFSNQKRKMTQKFITEHPDSYVSLQQLADLEFAYTVDGFAVAYQGLSDRMKKTPTAAVIRAKIEKAKVTPTGSIAADFKRKDQHGKSVKLSDYKGKLVLLDFWGSWCFVCREGHPHLKKLYETYKDKGLVILGVAKEHSKDLEKNRAAWLAAIQADGIDWVNVLDDEGTGAASIVEKYGVSCYPTKLLLDENGKVLMRVMGTMNDEISERIKLILDK